MADTSKRILILSTAFLFMLCRVPVIDGSLAKIPEVSDLVEWSDLIITGNVTYITPDEWGGFYRDVTVEIKAYYLGSPNSSAVIVRVFGGENYVSSVPDANFSTGEKVLVFLRLSGGVYRVAGGPFGKYLVTEGSPYPLNRVKEIISNSSDIPVEQVGTSITIPETGEDPKGDVATTEPHEPDYTLGFYGIVGILVISFLYVSGEQIVSVFKSRTPS